MGLLLRRRRCGRNITWRGMGRGSKKENDKVLKGMWGPDGVTHRADKVGDAYLFCVSWFGIGVGQRPWRNGSAAFSPDLCSGNAGVGKSCFLCCSRRCRLSSSSCWAALVTASNWCSLSNFLRRQTSDTVRRALHPASHRFHF